jgi:hypothetical protein
MRKIYRGIFINKYSLRSLTICTPLFNFLSFSHGTFFLVVSIIPFSAYRLELYVDLRQPTKDNSDKKHTLKVTMLIILFLVLFMLTEDTVFAALEKESTAHEAS